ncbi:PepSY domain-containing protein [Chitinophaga sp. sic0106]|uniref:PepSY-associated TM helix domain-containing protein n=1 Tax=Chitinophaga sp. sic0106 TaxID=2854785 RepID=UPI001C46FB2E|nr:PepSY-associated TM helix domain-containing protein [Chitinophaga sp. sic0106]MBV7530666.1 PepSY domain-containing protein [Chitinophaga sp. sic0106]
MPITGDTVVQQETTTSKGKSNIKKAKKPSFLRRLAAVLHLWLGLASGLVIMIVALTGAIYAFQPELSDAFQPYLFVEKASTPVLPVSKLKTIAESQLPGKRVSRITLAGADRSAAISFNDKKKGYYYIVYINQYTGQVIRVKDMDRDFFRQVLNGHMHLWLPDPVGHYIVVYAALIFGIIILSGLILWWPKKWSKATRKQSLAIKLDASPKRLNYDLHNVLGFYASWIMIFVVATGLVWGFDAVRNAEYFIFSGGKQYPEQQEKAASSLPAVASPLDSIDVQIRRQYNIYTGRTQFLLPANPKAVVTVRYFPEEKRNFNADYLSFDQQTGTALPDGPRGKYKDVNGGELANRLTYDVHTGGIGGLPLRTVIFLAALITASLPVTGFYIWWGKRKKKK